MSRYMADKIRGIPEWEYYLNEECGNDMIVALSNLVKDKILMRGHEKCLKRHLPDVWQRLEKLAILI
jgi:hypothetical protein